MLLCCTVAIVAYLIAVDSLSISLIASRRESRSLVVARLEEYDSPEFVHHVGYSFLASSKTYRTIVLN
jgi:hypothetical protein